MIIAVAMVLFVTGWISSDIVAVTSIVAFVTTGVIDADQGLSGFSNGATLTVLFMFVLSAAMLKTGALQYLASNLSRIFNRNYNLGLFVMMFLVALISAFINNTPVVAVFIPVVFQISKITEIPARKLLIPLSFASILGGMTTLMGSSTNMLVSAILEKEVGESIGMFTLAPIGLIIMSVGMIYLVFFSLKFLPRKKATIEPEKEYLQYTTQIRLLKGHPSIGKQILNSNWVKEYAMDIVQVTRENNEFFLPQGDLVLREGDLLKVRSSAEKIALLKDQSKIEDKDHFVIAGDSLTGKYSTLVELVVKSSSDWDKKTLKDIDFRRKYRAVPLAIQRRDDLPDDLYQAEVRSGDVILAEVKNHYVKELKSISNGVDAPFVLLSEQTFMEFNLKRFILALVVLFLVVLMVTTGWMNMAIAAMSGMIVLVAAGSLTPNEAYDSVKWKVVFLLAGALSMGTAMHESGLDVMIGDFLINNLGGYGNYVVLGALFIICSILTEVMSNSGTAALMAPIALVLAETLGVNYMPFIMAVTIASSASFMTPIGYQTNTMVYEAGNYKFTHFLRVGLPLNLLVWILGIWLIPMIYPF